MISRSGFTASRDGGHSQGACATAKGRGVVAHSSNRRSESVERSGRQMLEVS